MDNRPDPSAAVPPVRGTVHGAPLSSPWKKSFADIGHRLSAVRPSPERPHHDCSPRRRRSHVAPHRGAGDTRPPSLRRGPHPARVRRRLRKVRGRQVALDPATTTGPGRIGAVPPPFWSAEISACRSDSTDRLAPALRRGPLDDGRVERHARKVSTRDPVPGRLTARRVADSRSAPPVNPTTSENRTFGKAPMRTSARRRPAGRPTNG